MRCLIHYAGIWGLLYRNFANRYSDRAMHKLPPVEEAKALFEEAKEWGVWRWLTEKGRARRTADAAWEALEAHEKEVKAGLSGEQRRAAAKELKDLDAECNQAREDAEAQFDEADRRLSTDMACQGAQMAIDAWKMREKLLRKLEGYGKQG
jgi:hypothetical protein